MDEFLNDLMYLLNKHSRNPALGQALAILSTLGSCLSANEESDKKDVDEMFLLSLSILNAQMIRTANEIKDLSENVSNY